MVAKALLAALFSIFPELSNYLSLSNEAFMTMGSRKDARKDAVKPLTPKTRRQLYATGPRNAARAAARNGLTSVRNGRGHAVLWPIDVPLRSRDRTSPQRKQNRTQRIAPVGSSPRLVPKPKTGERMVLQGNPRATANASRMGRITTPGPGPLPDNPSGAPPPPARQALRVAVLPHHSPAIRSGCIVAVGTTTLSVPARSARTRNQAA